MHCSISTVAALTGALWLSAMPLSSQAEVFLSPPSSRVLTTLVSGQYFKVCCAAKRGLQAPFVYGLRCDQG